MERIVLALDAMNEAHDGATFETDEREELCDYIDQSLAEHGVDVVDLTSRHGLGRYQLTDNGGSASAAHRRSLLNSAPHRKRTRSSREQRGTTAKTAQLEEAAPWLFAQVRAEVDFKGSLFPKLRVWPPLMVDIRVPRALLALQLDVYAARLRVAEHVRTHGPVSDWSPDVDAEGARLQHAIEATE